MIRKRVIAMEAKQERVIYHIDCNGFYAACECMDHPEWQDVPMAVAGNPEDRCGIILAKNERAKAYGVKTAETIYQALRKCPDLLLVPPHHDRYAQISRRVKGIFAEYTDQVESFGLDEAWLDVTGSLAYFRSTPAQLANTIRERVKREIGITVSVGVSFTKVFAKLASDMKKPDATTLITRENFRRRVWPLPADALLFVGHNAAEHLRGFGIQTIGDIALSDPAFLEKAMGKGGEGLWACANGYDDSPVRRIGEREPAKSIGNGMTFRRDLVGWDELKAGIIALSDEVAVRLRCEGMRCRAVQVSIRTPQMKLITRQCQLPVPTRLQKELVDACMQMLHANWRETAPVRALTVTAQHLIPEDVSQEQICLLDASGTQRSRLESMEKAMQRLRGKYGTGCIAMGYVDHPELGIHQPGIKKENLL